MEKITNAHLNLATVAYRLCLVVWYAFALQWLFAVNQLIDVLRFFPSEILRYMLNGTLNFYRFVVDFTPVFILIAAGCLMLLTVQLKHQMHTWAVFKVTLAVIVGFIFVAAAEALSLRLIGESSGGTAASTIAIRYVFLASVAGGALYVRRLI